MNLTDDTAFEALQEVLAERRRVRLDNGSSKLMRILFDLDPDVTVTREHVKVHFGRRVPTDYYARLLPAAISEMLKRASAGKLESGALVHLPAGDVKMVGRFPAWNYGSKEIWILPGADEVLIRVREGDPSLQIPSVEPCPAGSPKVPPPLPPWKPAEKKWKTFDPPLTCPTCGASSATYRDCDTYLVCEACGCSFDMPRD